MSRSAIGGVRCKAEYTMVITERKRKKDGLLPHGEHTCFATDVPGTGVDEYSRRWGIETGYRMAWKAGAKTHSKDPVVRLLCFAYPAAFLNAWVMTNAVVACIAGTCKGPAGHPAAPHMHGAQVLHL